MPVFPSAEWLRALADKLNSDERYAQVARNWEGDMRFIVEPEGPLSEPVCFYFDLWHGKCREALVEGPTSERAPAFTLRALYGVVRRILQGNLDPMQAMLTRKLFVKGNMAVMMRNVPTVLDFVRCCREVTDEVL